MGVMSALWIVGEVKKFTTEGESLDVNGLFDESRSHDKSWAEIGLKERRVKKLYLINCNNLNLNMGHLFAEKLKKLLSYFLLVCLQL